MVRALVLLLALAACPSHRHEQVGRPDDPRRLYVEVSAHRSHKGPLRDGVRAGLARIPFAVPVPLDRGGDVELQVEVARLDVVGHQTLCTIKILVLRLPQHDLLGMAEGSARAGGTHAQAGQACIEGLGESLVGGKVRTLLHRRLGEKR